MDSCLFSFSYVVILTNATKDGSIFKYENEFQIHIKGS